MSARGKNNCSWSQSAEWCVIARAAIQKWNADRPNRPKCGARRKYDGGVCQQEPLSNGRCRFHGGKVPSGAGWHKPQWPNGKSPVAGEKLGNKLLDLERRRKRREARLARMTPEEREAHEKWHRARKAGPPGPRARRRAELANSKDLAERLSRPAERKPLSPGDERLAKLIAFYEARQATLQASADDAGVAFGAPGDERDSPAPRVDFPFHKLRDGVFG